ncbi:MAG: M1 family metallopeptidase [Flavobacteriales bacterium]|nr:M1 family metallopeptidase [Flavobacteriales bacterium]
MRRLLTILLAAFTSVATAQYNPLSPPNTFRSADNPLYWQNREHASDYWQQDVHYRIAANVDEQTDIISAKMELSYWNNSPDTLREVFFHLYQNAFQPGSFHDQLDEAKGLKNQFGKYEAERKGTEVLSLTLNGQEVKQELDNTILRIVPNEPLLPNSKTEFKIEFNSYFDQGSMGRRMKKFSSGEFTHFDGVHWYPRISVYDPKFGWTTDQHLGSEFYGDFGTFDVALTFASNYIVEATGFLLNREAVLPQELRSKLDLKNFADKPWGEPASTIIPYDTTQHKTWIFHAENVHDFAFTADPTYRIGETEWNGIKCIALAQESHASGWQNAADYTAKTIKVFSEGIGMYNYHKMIVADARDGMEYPMLTLDGGSDPDYRGLLVHEIGHNWFFGQVGNNETYRAALDEGFTQYLTVYGLRKIDGDTVVSEEPEGWYRRKFEKERLAIDDEIYYGFMRSATQYRDPQLNTHSDQFENNYYHGYGHVYYKTAAMFYNLEYVLGDTLFNRALQNYFDEWKFRHPYLDDFRNSFIRYTKVDLNWFFDQWMETTKHIDYSVKRIRKTNEGAYNIRFKRKGDMQMPIDFTVVDKNDSVHHFHIPNTWFVKETDATVLPKWTGFNDLNRTYDADVIVPEGIKRVIIDTTSRLADVYMLDNSSFTPISIEADHQVFNRSDWRKYELNARPDFWYNGFDGVKFGLHVNGGHFNTNHVFNAWIWANSGFGQWDVPSDVSLNEFMPVNFLFDYRTSLAKYWKNSQIDVSGRILDGLYNGEVGFQKKTLSDKTTFRLSFRLLYRHEDRDVAYLLNRDTWNAGKMNNSFNFDIKHVYRYEAGNGELNIGLRSSSLGSDYDYHQLKLEAKNTTKLWRLILKTRAFAQLGTGSDWAPESQLYLGGANPEEMMYNKYMRSSGIFPSDWATFKETGNFLHYGGGLNLRGYVGYLAPEQVEDGVVLAFAGNSGASINAELEFDEIFGLRPWWTRNWLDIDLYLFGDLGFISTNQPGETLSFAKPRADAGLGAAITIKEWGVLEKVKPLTIRFDMPLFLNRTPALDPEPWAFRWVIGISRAF